jgi:hypothetical protein
MGGGDLPIRNSISFDSILNFNCIGLISNLIS